MSANLCEHCTAACCRYVALPIETPDTKAEFDDIRWYLIHDAVSVFIEDGDWYISFHTPCRHILPDQRCGIYATRPRICRAYTTENCDYHSGDYGWDQHFTSPEHLDHYLRAHPEALPKPRRVRNGAAASRPRGTAARPSRRITGSLRTRTDRRGVVLPPLPEPA